MKKNIVTILFVLITTAFTGCKKFLDVKSDKKLVVPKSIADIQGILDDADKMNLRTTPSYGESSSDDYFLTAAALNVFNEAGRGVYTWKYVDYRFQNDWSLAYNCIYSSNLALELLEGVERNNANMQKWDNIKGLALFYRAYYGLLLLGQFGLAYDPATAEKDLGIVIRKISDFNVPSFRSSVKDCFEWILNDLKESLNYLPVHPQHVMRPSKTAGLGLMARAYLYMRDYENALKFTNEALNLKPVLMDYNTDPDIISLSAAVPFKPFNKEIIFYAEMAGGFSIHAVNRANVDTLLYSSYHADDLRKPAFFLANDNYQRFKGSYTSNASALFTGIAVDELVLMQAECLTSLNRVNEGMNVLNMFLKKRWKNTVVYQPLTATNREDALKKIREERRKSLLNRNLRWMDIKRQNKEGANIILKRIIQGEIFTLLPNSPFYALPLPADIIQQTGMPQN